MCRRIVAIAWKQDFNTHGKDGSLVICRWYTPKSTNQYTTLLYTLLSTHRDSLFHPIGQLALLHPLLHGLHFVPEPVSLLRTAREGLDKGQHVAYHEGKEECAGDLYHHYRGGLHWVLWG